MKSWSVTFQMKATEQYFAVVLFILLFKVFLTLKTVHSNPVMLSTHTKLYSHAYVGYVLGPPWLTLKEKYIFSWYGSILARSVLLVALLGLQFCRTVGFASKRFT